MSGGTSRGFFEQITACVGHDGPRSKLARKYQARWPMPRKMALAIGIDMSLDGRPAMEEKNASSVDRQTHRKVGIRPFKVGQPQRARVMSARVCARQAALDGRMPTFWFVLVARTATGVFFFQGGCKRRPLP